MAVIVIVTVLIFIVGVTGGIVSVPVAAAVRVPVTPAAKVRVAMRSERPKKTIKICHFRYLTHSFLRFFLISPL